MDYPDKQYAVMGNRRGNLEARNSFRGGTRNGFPGIAGENVPEGDRGPFFSLPVKGTKGHSEVLREDEK